MLSLLASSVAFGGYEMQCRFHNTHHLLHLDIGAIYIIHGCRETKFEEDDGPAIAEIWYTHPHTHTDSTCVHTYILTQAHKISTPAQDKHEVSTQAWLQTYKLRDKIQPTGRGNIANVYPAQ